MPPHMDSFKDSLSRNREVTISVTGRKSGRTISNPIWFVLENNDLYLLPVYGSQTQWFKNVLKNPTIEIDAHGTTQKSDAVVITDPTKVSSVADKFRKKYTAGDVKKYYSNFDVAVVIRL